MGGRCGWRWCRWSQGLLGLRHPLVLVLQELLLELQVPVLVLVSAGCGGLRQSNQNPLLLGMCLLLLCPLDLRLKLLQLLVGMGVWMWVVVLVVLVVLVLLVLQPGLLLQLLGRHMCVHCLHGVLGWGGDERCARGLTSGHARWLGTS